MGVGSYCWNTINCRYDKNIFFVKMRIALINKSIVVSDMFAVISTAYFILVAIFTKNPCLSFIESYGVITPIFVSYLGKFYQGYYLERA